MEGKLACRSFRHFLGPHLDLQVAAGRSTGRSARVDLRGGGGGLFDVFLCGACVGMLMNACQRIPGKMHMLELFLWTGFIFVIVFVMPREL